MLSNRQRSDFEARLRVALSGVTGGQSRELIRLMGSPPDVGNVPAAYWAALDAHLVAAIEPIIVQMAIASAAGLGAQAGIASAVNWGLVNTRAANWASRYTFNLVRGIDATTRDMLQREVARFFKNAGIDLKTLAANIQPGIPALETRLGQVLTSAARADMIATTEATRAAAEGEGVLMAEIRSKNPNVLMAEYFQTSADEIVCVHICRPLNGVRGDGQGNFVNPADGQVYRIPAHPRCRCARRLALAGLPTIGGL